MTIDFTGIKGVADDYGNVTKITDALGNVLWNAVKLVNLTITSFWDGMDGDTARITINSPSPFAPNPSEPNNKVTSWTAYVYDLSDQQNRTIKIPVGSTIECYITRDKGNTDSYIKLNDVKMATGEGTYVYTVTGDATIDVSEDYIQGDFGVISIVGAVTHISFTMNDETYQAIEGMSWKAWFASSYNTTGETQGTLTDVDGNEIDLNTVIMDGVRVLWSAVKPVTSLMLRPNQDVDVDTTVWTLCPSGSTTAYSLLSEEVADNASTYIYASVQAGTNAACVIGLGCENTLNRIPTITSGMFYASYCTGVDAIGSVRLYINDILSDSNTIATIGSVSTTTSYVQNAVEITADGIAKINEYVATNGNLPTFLMYAKFRNGGSSKLTVQITQTYVELTCDT